MAGYFAAAPQHDPLADPNHEHWDADAAPNDNDGEGAERVRVTIDLGATQFNRGQQDSFVFYSFSTKLMNINNHTTQEGCSDLMPTQPLPGTT